MFIGTTHCGRPSWSDDPGLLPERRAPPEGWDKRKTAGALESSRRGSRSACLQVSLTFLVVSLPDGGRRARYGKLRFPDFPRSLAAMHARPAKPELARPLAISSLTLAPPADKEVPFYPPGPPLPFRSSPLVATRPVRLLGKASVSDTRSSSLRPSFEPRWADETRLAQCSVSGGSASVARSVGQMWKP